MRALVVTTTMRLPTLALVLVTCCPMGFAQAPSEREIMRLVGSCLVEYAPANWQTFIVTIDETAPPENGRKVIQFEHKVVVGKPDNPPQDHRPCLPLFVPGKLNELRATLPKRSRGWDRATLVIQRDGRYDIKYKYPGDN